MPFAITLHVLSAVIWVGGMFFAYMALRPAAASMLEPPLRLPLWSKTFARFFPWVWAAVILLPASGYWMIFSVLGGFANVKPYIHVMQATGIAMILIYFYVYLICYQRMNRAIALRDYAAAGKQLAIIRRLIGINLILGLITIAVATGGAYWK
ncbi:MAG: CopD family protein [Sulfuricaulis sp.]